MKELLSAFIHFNILPRKDVYKNCRVLFCWNVFDSLSSVPFIPPPSHYVGLRSWVLEAPKDIFNCWLCQNPSPSSICRGIRIVIVKITANGTLSSNHTSMFDKRWKKSLNIFYLCFIFFTYGGIKFISLHKMKKAGWSHCTTIRVICSHQTKTFNWYTCTLKVFYNVCWRITHVPLNHLKRNIIRFQKQHSKVLQEHLIVVIMFQSHCLQEIRVQWFIILKLH